MKQQGLEAVNRSEIPAPVDDGSADHLTGMSIPEVTLPSTHGSSVDLAQLTGWTVLFFYPMTGRPDAAAPDGWDDIPGARGCTAQSCAFRDLSRDLADKGVSAVFGISTQDTGYQKEAADRLHLPFGLLSDANLELTHALDVPTMTVEGRILLKRLTLVLFNTRIKRVFFPVFPPHRNAADVLEFMDSRHQSF